MAASPNALALSAKYGIPAAIPINDHKRYSYCDAHEATLEDVSPDGQFATYRGVCSCRHVYMERFEVEELKRKTRVVIAGSDYKYEYDDGKVNSSDSQLEEY